MQKVQKKVWQLIDDDSAQYVSYLDPAAGTTGKVFDFAQVTALPDGYVIVDLMLAMLCVWQKLFKNKEMFL